MVKAITQVSTRPLKTFAYQMISIAQDCSSSSLFLDTYASQFSCSGPLCSCSIFQWWYTTPGTINKQWTEGTISDIWLQYSHTLSHRHWVLLESWSSLPLIWHMAFLSGSTLPRSQHSLELSFMNNIRSDRWGSSNSSYSWLMKRKNSGRRRLSWKCQANPLFEYEITFIWYISGKYDKY